MNRSYLLVILVMLLLTVSLVSPAFAYAKKPYSGGYGRGR